ncbi:MAG: hypothetical protein AABX30_01960 [Nanoarchaeota archaeon]
MTEIKIIQNKENPLFERKEIKFLIESSNTPTISNSIEIISEKFSSTPEKIRIHKIKGKFGRNSFLITADIYKTKEAREKYDNTYKQEDKEKIEEKKENK